MACKNLESKGTITRSDGYQEILNSIANDIRTKNRKQIQRAKDLKSMQNALDHLEEKRTGLEEQIQMYKTHNAQSISNMQDKGYVPRVCLVSGGAEDNGDSKLTSIAVLLLVVVRRKRSSVLPLTKQFWHRRSLRADGKMPEYGSWVYESRLLVSFPLPLPPPWLSFLVPSRPASF